MPEFFSRPLRLFPGPTCPWVSEDVVIGTASILIYYMGNRSFRLQVVSPTSRFAYIEVVSPTRPKSFRLHGLS